MILVLFSIPSFSVNFFFYSIETVSFDVIVLYFANVDSSDNFDITFNILCPFFSSIYSIYQSLYVCCYW